MYRYRITVESLTPGTAAQSMQFEAENHDDIFAIASRTVSSGRLGLDENATKAFVVGLKLFGETVLKNRTHPLFAPMKDALDDFIRNLKGQPAHR
jgi:hypothetical protein